MRLLFVNLSLEAQQDISPRLFNLFPNYIVHKSDIGFLSETYLDFTAPLGNLVVTRHNLVHSDHPSHSKRRGVCIYYKNCLLLRVLNICCLKECLSFEFKIDYECSNFVVLYRSPSQSHGGFETFTKKMSLQKICDYSRVCSWVYNSF